MSVAKYSKALTQDEHGIWKSAQPAAVNYPDSGNETCFQLEDTSFWFRHRNDCIAAVVKRYPPEGTILDVGGGNGFVARRLLDEGYDTTVLEPDVVAAFNAKTQRGIPEVLCGTLESAGFEPESIAAMSFFDVLEHIEDDTDFMSQAHKALRPGGMVYVTVPACSLLWSYSDDSAQHFRRYNRHTLSELLRERFEILYYTHLFGPLILPVVLFRVLPYRLGLPRNRKVLSRETEHTAGGGITVRVLKKLLHREVQKTAVGKVIPLGTSCLCVARKKG
jgi:SAM-dependent methyltransferase